MTEIVNTQTFKLMTDTQDNKAQAPEQPSKPLFTSPYPAGDPNNCQLVLQISKYDHGYVKSARPTQGTLTIVAGMLWSKFCAACRSKCIIDMRHQDEFEDLAINGVFIHKDELDSLVADAIAWRQHQAGNGTLLIPAPKKTSSKKKPSSTGGEV